MFGLGNVPADLPLQQIHRLVYVVFNRSKPLPAFVNVAREIVPATGPAHVTLKFCTSMAPPESMVMPRSGELRNALAFHCSVPPSRTTCAGRNAPAAGLIGNPHRPLIFHVPSLMIRLASQTVFAVEALAKKVPLPVLVRFPNPAKAFAVL